LTRSAPASAAGADWPARPDIGAQYPSRLVRALSIPAAFFAANWAALLLALTVVGTVPALIAATRTTVDLHLHADRAFRETLRHGARLLRRDWVLSVALWAMLAVGVGNALILTDLAAGGTRVLLAGMALPPTWLAVAFFSAYVVVGARAEPTAALGTVARAALMLLLTRPLRALAVPAVIVAVSPLWLLAPLTIAIGLSLPPFLVAKVWGEPSADARAGHRITRR